MNGYLDIHGARAFLGNKSVSWLRLHLQEIPHLKLYDRLLFDPKELRAYVEATAERHVPVNAKEMVATVMAAATHRSRKPNV